ncbi:MAG: alkaline phosphatase [Bacillota bacterium]
MAKKSATHEVDKAKNKQLAIIIAIILIVVIISSAGLFAAFYYTDYSVNPDISEDFSAKNVILLIGSGMGQNQIDTASLTQDLYMTTASYQGTISTRSLSILPTNSAAAATAMATGSKVFNDNISYLMGESLTNLGTLVSDSSKSLGIVTNSYACGATPAAFTSSVKSADSLSEIAYQQISNSEIDYLVGLGSQYYNDYASLINTDTREYLTSYSDLTSSVANEQFAILGDNAITTDGECTLASLTQDALAKLSNNDDGFFLMVESDSIETASQENDIDSMIAEVIAFDSAVQVAMTYATMHQEDTLVIVVGDHETGWLAMPKDDAAENISDDNFGASFNSYRDTMYYATGVGAEAIPTHIDNSDIFSIIVDILNLI